MLKIEADRQMRVIRGGRCLIAALFDPDDDDIAGMARNADPGGRGRLDAAVVRSPGMTALVPVEY